MLKGSGDERPRAIVFGGHGKMGTAFVRCLQTTHRCLSYGRRDFDLCDRGALAQCLEEAQPHLVVNCVAKMGIDDCERSAAQAFELNAIIPGLIAQQCERFEIPLVHMSTDSVFSDREGGAWVESDLPTPLNVYGASKLAGEHLVSAHASRHYVVRTSVLFGETSSQPQLFEKLIAKAREGGQLRVADDVICSPSWATDVAMHVVDLVTKQANYGTYHVINGGQASLFEVVSAMMRELKLGTALERCSHNDFPSIGKKNSRTPMRSKYGLKLRPWQDALHEYCQTVLAVDE